MAEKIADLSEKSDMEVFAHADANIFEHFFIMEGGKVLSNMASCLNVLLI